MCVRDINVVMFYSVFLRFRNDALFFVYSFYVHFAGFSWECLTEWNIFLNLAVPGIAMLCLEWWCFEIFVFICGMFIFAKYAIIYVYCTLLFITRVLFC